MSREQKFLAAYGLSLIAALLLLGPAEAVAAPALYMHIETANGQPLNGSSMLADHRGDFELTSFMVGPPVGPPMSGVNGREQTGRAGATPVMVRTDGLDASLVTALRYAVRGELFKSVTISEYGSNRFGSAAQAVFTIMLQNVAITSVEANVAGAAEGAAVAVRFTAQRVEFMSGTAPQTPAMPGTRPMTPARTIPCRPMFNRPCTPIRPQTMPYKLPQ